MAQTEEQDGGAVGLLGDQLEIDLLSDSEIPCETNDDEEGEAATCRVCYDTEGPTCSELVAPCDCRGTVKYVHVECLRMWQDSQLNYGADLEEISKCALCRSRYRIPDGDQQARRKGFVVRHRTPILAGRTPQEVFDKMVTLLRVSPVSTLMSVWKVLVFLTGTAHAIAGGVRGMDKGYHLGVMVLRTVADWVPYGGALLNASNLVYAVTSELPGAMQCGLWTFVAAIATVAGAEVILAVVLGGYFGMLIGFVSGAASAVRTTGNLAVRSAWLGSLLCSTFARTSWSTLRVLLSPFISLCIWA